MTDEQLQTAAELWAKGRDTLDIAAVIGLPESSVWRAMDDIRGTRRPVVLAPAPALRLEGSAVMVPRWVPAQHRRSYVAITNASGEEAAASAVRAHLRQGQPILSA